MRTNVMSQAQVGIFSFGRLEGKSPTTLRYSVNCTSLRDPLGHKTFKKEHADGRAPEVQTWIKEGDKRVEAILDSIRLAVQLAIEGGDERYVSVGFWDHHGKWTAPAIAELCAEDLSDYGYSVIVTHMGVK